MAILLLWSPFCKTYRMLFVFLSFLFLFLKQRRSREGGRDFQSCFLSLTRFNRFLVLKSVLSSANKIDPQNSWCRGRELKLNIAYIQSYSGISTQIWNHFCIPGKPDSSNGRLFWQCIPKSPRVYSSLLLSKTSSSAIFLSYDKRHRTQENSSEVNSPSPIWIKAEY